MWFLVNSSVEASVTVLFWSRDMMWKRTSFYLSAMALSVQKEICSQLANYQTFEKLQLSQGAPSEEVAKLLEDGIGQVQPLI